jgi:hypothetical protein
MNAIYVEERERESTAAARCICIFINDFCAFDFLRNEKISKSPFREKIR